MKEQIIKFETAKLAKAKGFFMIPDMAYNLHGQLGNYYDVVGESPFSDDENDPVDYSSLRYVAPTQSVLQGWLREKGLDVDITVNWSQGRRTYGAGFSYLNDRKEYCFWMHTDDLNETIHLPSYEDALEIVLQEGLKLIRIGPSFMDFFTDANVEIWETKKFSDLTKEDHERALETASYIAGKIRTLAEELKAKRDEKKKQ